MDSKQKVKAAGLKTRDHLKVLQTNPTLFQVNTRVWLTELSNQLGRQATLDDVPDSVLDELAEQGFAWVYFLSVWQTGEAGRRISINHPGWKDGFKADIPDLTDDDICGSGFAVTDYSLHANFGTPDVLLRLKDRVNQRGMKLMLDLVPNHTAIDHGWVKTHPEYFVQGDENAIASAPQNYLRVEERIFAHGRDPYFDGWPDTLQLNYGNPAFREAMFAEISKIATTCDGLRCDMAMLVLPDVFSRTWGIDIEPFWPTAIATIREKHPDFTFMAEVYWDREWDLQQQGFDFTYDKRLYDRLRMNEARPVREHFWAASDYQQRSARFLENHDEPRAAGTFSPEQHKAASVITFFSQGLRFLHQGQFEGYRKRVSVHVRRKPKEAEDREIKKFYAGLLECLKLPAVHNGNWSLLECAQAWDGNWTSDCFIVFSWKMENEPPVYVIVNYSGHQSQCYVKTPQGTGLKDVDIRMSSGDDLKFLELTESGFFVDFPAWGYAVLIS
ncbi:MAG: alpha-amylase [Candidatus Melainabacteria bacterium]|jgi:hypothetical protein|nr:alpha-amylase [Candidatus Melainabacteria bacterium]